VKLLPDPTDIQGNAIFQKWASVEKDNWDNYASPMAFERIFKV
jgi:glutathione S-transferase